MENKFHILQRKNGIKNNAADLFFYFKNHWQAGFSRNSLELQHQQSSKALMSNRKMQQFICICINATLISNASNISYSQVLSDSDKRKTYDQHGEEGVKKMGGFEDGGGFDPFSS